MNKKTIGIVAGSIFAGTVCGLVGIVSGATLATGANTVIERSSNQETRTTPWDPEIVRRQYEMGNLPLIIESDRSERTFGRIMESVAKYNQGHREARLEFMPNLYGNDADYLVITSNDGTVTDQILASVRTDFDTIPGISRLYY